jgi:transcriptional regulator with XRE-family HTH domain
MSTTLPEAIRAARLEAGLSQRALAERIGVTQPAISFIEHGRNLPTLGHALVIARELEIGPWEAFFDG